MAHKRVRDIAADHPVTTERLHEILTVIDNEIRLPDYYLRKAEQDKNIRLVWFNLPSDYVFAIGTDIWEELIEDIGLEQDEKEAGRNWHNIRSNDLLRSWGKSVSEELGPGETYLRVPTPNIETWQWFEGAMIWWFSKAAEMGLSPAEILDYWVLETQDQSSSEWGDTREVTAEAVRKNRRQAAEKVRDTPLRL